MNQSKTKFRHKFLAIALSVMMLIAMVPATVLTSAWGNTDPAYDYLSAQGFFATYTAADDSIRVSWTAIDGAVDSLSIAVDGGEAVALDAAATSYTTSAADYAGKTVAIALTAVCGEDGRTVEASVAVPGTLNNVPATTATMDNNLSLESILSNLPKEMPVVTTNKAYINAPVVWSPDGIVYDRNLATEQVFDVFGVVTLPENVINRNNVSLAAKVTVTVLAAESVAVKTDLDGNPISKQAGESLLLSVEGAGTVMGYQWYRDGVAIDGACSATLNIISLSPADSGNYYCEIQGKGTAIAVSKTVAVAVTKLSTAVGIAVTPNSGQTRPTGVTLQATGIPGDATGTLTFMANGVKVGQVQLPSISMTFYATEDRDDYALSVIYSGDARYDSSESAAMAYNFNKGTIHMGGISGLTGVAGSSVQIMNPTTYLEPQAQYPVTVTYKYYVSDPTVAEVNDYGRLTYKKAGEVELTIEAYAGNDYNVASIVIPITVNLAENSGLEFNTNSGSTQYQTNFSYEIPYYDNSFGDGELRVELQSAEVNVDRLVATLDTQKKIIVITYADDIDGTDPALKETLTGAINVKLIKAGGGVYNDLVAVYELTINKGKQNPLSVKYENVNVVYGETGTLQGGDDVTGGTVRGALEYAVDDASIVSLDGNTFEAKRAGKQAVITVKKPGNALYNEVSCQYAIIVNQGEMEGFAFEKSEITSPFGVTVNNIAAGGPDIEGSTITYAVHADSDKNNIGQYLVVNGSQISFAASAYLAENRDTYTVVITATKTGGENYKDATATYTLTLTRKAIQQSDLVLDGAEYLSNGNIRSNFGNEDKSKTGVTITPANGYNSIFLNGEWYNEPLLLEESIDNTLICLKKADGELSQNLSQTIIVDKQGPGATDGNVKITIGTNAFSSDAINSVWSGVTGALSFDLFENSSKDVVIEAKDDISPIKDIFYFVQYDNFVSLDKDPADITLEDIQAIIKDFEWTHSESAKDILTGKFKAQFTIELPENTTKKAVVYVKIVDAANNVSYFRSSGVIFDNMAPSCDVDALPNSVINVSLPEVDGQVGLYNGAVDFDVTIADKNDNGISAGIQKVEITVKGVNGTTGEWYEKKTVITAKQSQISELHSQDLKLDDVKALFDVEGDFTIPASFDSNHLSILVEVWDFAGNKASNEYSKTHLAIDSSKPAIDVFYQELYSADHSYGGFTSDLEGNDSKYLGVNQYRRAEITIKERNFDPSKVDFSRLLLDGETLGVNPTFTCIGTDYNGDSYVWVAAIDFTKDGDYTFNISCTDKAGNKNSDFTHEDWIVNPRTWTIDNTKPVIHVVMSNNNVQNGSYFAAARMATITITERNFKDADQLFANWVGITLNGTVGTAPKATLIKSDDETYERVYTVAFSKDGDYKFDVSYTDLAGNTSDGYTCNSVAYESFTVDTTVPAVSITGVAHQNAYNYDDVVAPIVNYSDINIDSSTAFVRLTGVRNGTVQYKTDEAVFSTGKRIRYNDFSKVSYVDDIYTLSVAVTDKAGNSSSQVVTFSVNRFGSTYNLSMIEDINGKYLQEERDIVFTETNVTELDHETLLIKMIKDGTPTALVEGTDYTIDKTGGDGQWSVYTYTIKKELFASDGHYNISVYSEDAAGNINESDSEEKKADISFAIDKTAPVIVPIDLEDDTPYATDNKTVSVEIKDNLLLDGVKILLNGKEIEYIADGDNYTFDIGQSGDKQSVSIVAVDAAGNTLPIEVKGVLVNASFLVRWYNNTPLFIATLAGVVLLILLLTTLALFGKKKEKK